LKKYISDGRSIVSEIEEDTLKENPPLFKEYIAAPPELRAIMDNQFKNIKVHARGESKATWYEWRSKLFDGLKTGLLNIHEGFIQDDQLLGNQEKLLAEHVPALVERYDALKATADTLQAHADAIANSDQDELRQARKDLASKEEEILIKKNRLAELQEALKEQQRVIEAAQERKTEYIAEIKEAERVANENRGWTYEEVKAAKGRTSFFV
jgi:kinetochore protein Spc7/SPC105